MELKGLLSSAGAAGAFSRLGGPPRMPYEVTATRKRPQTFSALVGQEFVAATLTSSIQQGRIAHAYLFAGPRGVGKTSVARILAKALNCEKGPTAEPCGVCPSCVEIARGASLDVIEIDGASNTSVNDVREIRDEVLFAPNSSRYKVYIIDEVHMLSNSAFNALLKTIEEPPPYIVFIFATTEVHKVPATIRSRCQQYNFRLISTAEIKGKLQEASRELGVAGGGAGPHLDRQGSHGLPARRLHPARPGRLLLGGRDHAGQDPREAGSAGHRRDERLRPPPARGRRRAGPGAARRQCSPRACRSSSSSPTSPSTSATSCSSRAAFPGTRFWATRPRTSMPRFSLRSRRCRSRRRSRCSSPCTAPSASR